MYHNVSTEIKPEAPPEEAETAIVTRGPRCFTGDAKVSGVDEIKGALLATADRMVSTLSEILLENATSDKGLIVGKTFRELLYQHDQWQRKCSNMWNWYSPLNHTAYIQ